MIRLEVVIPENSYHFHMLGCAHYSGTCHLWEEIKINNPQSAFYLYIYIPSVHPTLLLFLNGFFRVILRKVVVSRREN